MVFPNDVETGIGLAGPTADIGHEDAHAANGIPRLLEAIQNAVGTDLTPVSFTPTWSCSIQPAINDCWWAKVGNLVFFNVYGLWDAYATCNGGIASFPAPAAWGTIRGPNNYATGMYYDADASELLIGAAFVAGTVTFRLVYASSSARTTYVHVNQISTNDNISFSGVVAVL